MGALVAVVLLIAVGWYAASHLGNAETDGLQAVVHDGDGGVTALPLSQDKELAVSTSYGTNVVVVQDGAVYVREADCDNQDCVRQGKISAPGRQIICLPHKLWIEITDEGSQGAPDMDVNAVAGASDADANSDEGALDAVAR